MDNEVRCAQRGSLMIVIVCLDDKGGMMFNHRRQSRDKILCEQILRLTKHAVLHMSHYSARLFSDLNPPNLAVSDTFLRDAGNGDFCFVEDAALAPVEQRIEKLIIFKWNRTYPADRYFDLKPYEGAWHLALSSDFAGSSHERITMEVFER